ATLLICFARGTLAADAGAYRAAPARGWTGAAHHSVGRAHMRRVVSGQRLARAAWSSPDRRRRGGSYRLVYSTASSRADSPSGWQYSPSTPLLGATVIDRGVLDDMNARTPRDVLPYAAGVTVR